MVPVVQSINSLGNARFTVWVSGAVDRQEYHCSKLAIRLHVLRAPTNLTELRTAVAIIWPVMQSSGTFPENVLNICLILWQPLSRPEEAQHVTSSDNNNDVYKSSITKCSSGISTYRKFEKSDILKYLSSRPRAS
ncbi:hypothetical protein TNCV_1253951 [Trichonephila clavipes]|nr:hypothetical protein TNCV_1253951 [Trichonephila clavipes]